MIQSSTFWRTVISGFIATYTMMMVSFLLSVFGLPVIDVGYFLTQVFNMVHEGEPYGILWGNVAYYIIGILLALIWVEFLQKRISMHWSLQGIIYGVLISLLAALVVSPLVSEAGGDPFGLFYASTWFPFRTFVAGLVMHLAYGLVLMLCLERAGLREQQKAWDSTAGY